jgi:hypothetical protein
MYGVRRFFVEEGLPLAIFAENPDCLSAFISQNMGYCPI